MDIHLTLQGKGGVGKTLVTTLVAQHLQAKQQILCIDTDPINQTFSGFKALDVQQMQIMDGDIINPRRFDNLMETIFQEERSCVIDNGASSFIPLTAYLIESSGLDLLTENGKTVFVHIVITGGQALIDTVSGLNYLVNQFKGSVNIVVWLNEYFGQIEESGKRFEEMKVYKVCKSSIYGMITIPEVNKSTFGHDIQQMLQDRLTFDEALASNYTLMAKQRIKKMRDTLFHNIATVF